VDLHAVVERSRESDGSLAIEAAIGLLSLALVGMMLIESLTFGVWQVRSAVAMNESIRIATASGDPLLHIRTAQILLNQKLPNARSDFEPTETGVAITVTEDLSLRLLPLTVTMTAQVEGDWVDAPIG